MLDVIEYHHQNTPLLKTATVGHTCRSSDRAKLVSLDEVVDTPFL